MSAAPAVTERWLPVVGFEADYEVSDFGRVRSRTRVKVYTRRDQYSGQNLNIERVHVGRVLRPAPMKSGHLTVCLQRGRSVLVHHLVLNAFAGPCPDGMESLHRDGVPANNRLSNLRWGTRSENVIDAIAHGAIPIGELKFNAKLSEAAVREMRSQFGSVSYCSLARKYGVTESTIRQVANGETWRHVL